MSKKVITPKIEQYIRQNYLKQSSRKIANTLGISKSAVLSFLKRNNLVVPLEIRKKWQHSNKKKPYTKKEQSYIIKHIATKSIKKIALELGRSSTTCREECHRLGLSEIIEQKKQASRYKPGCIPHSKGKKAEEFMNKETLAKFKANQFKKGNVPHNAIPEGTEVQRKDSRGRYYTLIKVPGTRKLQYKHRVVWQSHFGNIPPGHNIIFKDGDTSNCSIENLKCVSNEELMQMNSYHDLPPSIKELIHLKSAITRQINKHSNHERKN